MTLLDNELVRDYFKAENCIHAPLAGTCDGCFALRILRAMEEPIMETRPRRAGSQDMNYGVTYSRTSGSLPR